ncbi:MAG: hypothetical protein WBQ64_11335 [Terriglobales bacterium]|jgi:hypothetical protein
MICAKALLTKALLFSLLTATYALAAPQDSSSTGGGQKPVKSLGEIAREARKNKSAEAKTVITDENLDVKRGPLPKLNLEGPENFDAIVQAVGDYKAKHSAQETEQVLHDWYSEYDSMLATMFRENLELQTLRDSNTYYSNESCSQGVNYKKCIERQRAEALGSRQDRSVMKDNWAVTYRVQTGITRVGEGMSRYNLRYDWWKVRYINSNF